MSCMTELPANDPHEVIHLGDEAAVVVPLDEYRQLRHDAQRARLIEQADAEEAVALAEYREQQAAGTVTTVPQAEVRRRFGLAAR
jgi:PHD/YefM family antitoxin component YafN of YafNO toxin-antitoxin module